jgi:hypothetical protein
MLTRDLHSQINMPYIAAYAALVLEGAANSKYMRCLS